LKATDWLIANCFLQEQILNNSSKPIQMQHAMLCYRTPESFAAKFQRTTNEELAILMLKVGCCIMAKKLQQRFQLALQNDESITENN
jgi:homoserine O-acetyltransferase